MHYSKKDLYNITRRLYYLLREHSDRIVFQKLYQNWYGTYDWDTHKITIDFRRDILSTLIHEALHHWHPDWSETKVARHESLIINSLSITQIKNIIKVLGENI